MKVYEVTGASASQKWYTSRIEAADGDEAARIWRRQVALETGQPEEEFTVAQILLCKSK